MSLSDNNTNKENFMKRLMATAVTAFFGVAAHSAEITDILVRQQWPWSTDVKVEYRVTGVTTPQTLRVTFSDGGKPLSATGFREAVRGDWYGVYENGTKSFVFDPVRTFGISTGEINDLRVSMSLEDSETDYGEVLYKIFDLTNGGVKDITRGMFLGGEVGPWESDFSCIGSGFNTTLGDLVIWTGVTNDLAYKTDKLVMRKVKATSRSSWMIGTSNAWANNYGTEPLHEVTLTEDYFIGVFALTSHQYAKIMGQVPDNARATYPVGNVSYYDVGSGYANGAVGTLPGGGTEVVNWPTNSFRHLVADGTFMDRLRKLTGVQFDLPTEAQWEVACRAGTTTELNSGKNITDWYALCPNVEALAWGRKSDYSSVGGTVQVMPVGLKKPNALGLYDMHGNVAEMCLDVYVADIDVTGGGDPLVDPVGALTPSANAVRTKRGGWATDNDANGVMRASNRNNWYGPGTAKPTIGFRVVCPAAASWK